MALQIQLLSTLLSIYPPITNKNKAHHHQNAQNQQPKREEEQKGQVPNEMPSLHCSSKKENPKFAHLRTTIVQKPPSSKLNHSRQPK
jgi:hypothetical protein